jgi:hypothetical protein
VPCMGRSLSSQTLGGPLRLTQDLRPTTHACLHHAASQHMKGQPWIDDDILNFATSCCSWQRRYPLAHNSPLPSMTGLSLMPFVAGMLGSYRSRLSEEQTPINGSLMASGAGEQC